MHTFRGSKFFKAVSCTVVFAMAISLHQSAVVSDSLSWTTACFSGKQTSRSNDTHEPPAILTVMEGRNYNRG